MKVLFDHPMPFALAHGGFQQQILQTKSALQQAGIETDFVRWWDDTQRGDLIHFAGRPSADYIAFAHGRGCKVVIAELLTATGSRSRGALALQKLLTAILHKSLPAAFTTRMAWDAYRLADACIALTPWEAHLMNYLFNAPKERIHVVPNGVEEIFLNSAPATRGPWLVCTASHHGAQAGAGTRPGRRLLPEHRSGSSANPIPNPIRMRDNFSRWRGTIRKSSAMKARWRIARGWPKSTARRAALFS